MKFRMDHPPPEDKNHRLQSVVLFVLLALCGMVWYTRLSSTTRNLSGQSPSILLRKTVLSLKSSTGAFIVPLRSTNANLLYYLFSINPIIEKINPTIPIPITSSPIPDEQREIMIAKSSIAIPKPIFFIETSPSQNSNLSIQSSVNPVFSRHIAY